MRNSIVFAAVIATMLAPNCAQADVVLYTVGGTELTFLLQGSVTINPGGTMSLRHPKFGAVHLSQSDCELIKVDQPHHIAAELRSKALATGDPEKMLKASRWALKNGLTREFLRGIDEILKMDPDHRIAKNVKLLEARMKEPIADSPKQREYIKKLVPVSGMRFTESKHYVLYHDTPEKPPTGTRKNRSTARLELLEKVYETYMYTMFSQGIYPRIPSSRLMVVLFGQQRDYLRFVSTIDPNLRSAAGFFNLENNLAMFYDQGTSPESQVLKAYSDRWNELAEKAIKDRRPDTADIVRTAKTIELITRIDRENQDIEVVSHEATHQLAGNTGILPRQSQIPIWAHEGLATYFEAPSDGAWAGIGAVNKERLAWYRALASDTEHSNIEFVVSDKIFQLAATHESRIHAYGQAWALTHFLMENHFNRFMQYYAAMGKATAKGPLSLDENARIFREVFKAEMPTLEDEWRRYMAGLKTDLETILDPDFKDARFR